MLFKRFPLRGTTQRCVFVPQSSTQNDTPVNACHPEPAKDPIKKQNVPVNINWEVVQ